MASLLILTACAGSPKTVDELRSRFKEGGSFFKTETHTIKRPVSAVVESLHRKAISCFNAVKTTKAWENGYYSTSSTAYLAILKQEARNKFALTIQDNIGNAIYIGGVPKGGQYNFLADVVEVNKSTTKIVLNGIVMKSTNYMEPILAWAKGQDAKCPI